MVQDRARREIDDLGLMTDDEFRTVQLLLPPMVWGVVIVPLTFLVLLYQIVPEIYYDSDAQGSFTQPSPIPTRICTPLPSHDSYTLIPYEPYESSSHYPIASSSQPLPCSYDLYASSSFVDPHTSAQSPLFYKPRVQMPLDVVRGTGAQLGASFLKQIISRVPADTSYSTAEYKTTDSAIRIYSPRLVRDIGDEGWSWDWS